MKNENLIKNEINELLKTESNYIIIPEKIKKIIISNTDIGEYLNFRKIILFNNLAIAYVYSKFNEELLYNFTSLVGDNDCDYDNTLDDEIHNDIFETVKESGHKVDKSVWSLIKFKNGFLHLYPISEDDYGIKYHQVLYNTNNDEIWEFNNEIEF